MIFNGEYPLNIPIPKSLACLPQQPPVCQSTINDLKALDLIRDFGQEFSCLDIEIEQALNLASGPSDIIIILQRPAPNHDYAVSFEQFVQDCRTLKAVDELIRFATKGARSIHTVTVLDAFTFKPKGRVGIPDERCHQLLADIIELKKPRLILQCHNPHNDPYKDSRLNELELPCKDYKNPTTKPKTMDAESVIQSFHPSVAVNRNKSRPEYRILLLLHFTLAFRRLAGSHCKRTGWRFIREQCTSKGDQDSFTNRADAAARIAEILDPVPKQTTTGCTIRFSVKNTVEQRISCDNMYKQLIQLSISPQELGAFEICRALRLWGDSFSDHCLSGQVTNFLFCRGSEQTAWRRPKSPGGARADMDEITSGFSNVQVQDTVTAQNAGDQMAENNSEDKGSKKGHSGGKTDVECVHERIKYAEEQCGIEESLRDSSLFNLTDSLRICRLVSWLKYQLQLFETDEAKEGCLKNFENEVASLIQASDGLKAVVEQLPVHERI